MFAQLSEIQWPAGINSERFLQEYWQQKPLFIPQAFPNFHSPISAETLAGLACDTEISSRIVAEKGLEKPWAVHYGPFESSDFTTLAETHWTLLVNDVEKYLTECYELLARFHFIPKWRIDDLMISYAAPEGSVGPHYDEYDVFLLQADGQRRWQIAAPISKQQTPELLSNLDLKILRNFQTTQEWITNPGDLLYLPPYVPHYGVSIDASLCYSVGFRAPSAQELLLDFAEHQYKHERGRQRLQDKNRPLQKHASEITAQDIAQLKQLLQQSLSELSERDYANWLGCLLTQARGHINPTDDMQSSSSEISYPSIQKPVQLNTLGNYKRHPNSHFAFIEHSDKSFSLFVDGESWSLPSTAKTFVQGLCEETAIPLKHLEHNSNNKKTIRIINTLIKTKKILQIKI